MTYTHDEIEAHLNQYSPSQQYQIVPPSLISGIPGISIVKNPLRRLEEYYITRSNRVESKSVDTLIDEFDFANDFNLK